MLHLFNGESNFFETLSCRDLVLPRLWLKMKEAGFAFKEAEGPRRPGSFQQSHLTAGPGRLLGQEARQAWPQPDRAEAQER
jgi:hypothetical protein